MLKVAVIDGFLAQVGKTFHRQCGIEIAKGRRANTVLEHETLGEARGAEVIGEPRKRLDGVEIPVVRCNDTLYCQIE